MTHEIIAHRKKNKEKWMRVEQKVCILVSKSKQDKFGLRVYTKEIFFCFLWHLADLTYCSYCKLQAVIIVLRFRSFIEYCHCWFLFETFYLIKKGAISGSLNLLSILFWFQNFDGESWSLIKLYLCLCQLMISLRFPPAPNTKVWKIIRQKKKNSEI